MTRQRIRLRTPAPAYLARLLALALSLALIWYGLGVVLLAAKVSRGTVDSLTAYRTVFHFLAGLTRRDFTTERRLIAGFGGLLAFLFLLYLAFAQLPRARLARGELALEGQERGTTTIGPRAIERVAEAAASDSPAVLSASGRLADGHVQLAVALSRPHAVADTLADVRARARAALAEHELPLLPVDVDLTALRTTTRRELT